MFLFHRFQAAVPRKPRNPCLCCGGHGQGLGMCHFWKDFGGKNWDFISTTRDSTEILASKHWNSTSKYGKFQWIWLVHPKSHMSSCRLSWKLTGTTLDIRILEVHDANKPWKLLESQQNDLKKNTQHILTQFFVLTTVNDAEPVNIHEACQRWP